MRIHKYSKYIKIESETVNFLFLKCCNKFKKAVNYKLYELSGVRIRKNNSIDIVKNNKILTIKLSTNKKTSNILKAAAMTGRYPIYKKYSKQHKKNLPLTTAANNNNFKIAKDMIRIIINTGIILNYRTHTEIKKIFKIHCNRYFQHRTRNIKSEMKTLNFLKFICNTTQQNFNIKLYYTIMLTNILIYSSNDSVNNSVVKLDKLKIFVNTFKEYINLNYYYGNYSIYPVTLTSKILTDCYKKFNTTELLELCDFIDEQHPPNKRTGHPDNKSTPHEILRLGCLNNDQQIILWMLQKYYWRAKTYPKHFCINCTVNFGLQIACADLLIPEVVYFLKAGASDWRRALMCVCNTELILQQKLKELEWKLTHSCFKYNNYKTDIDNIKDQINTAVIIVLKLKDHFELNIL